MKIREKIHVLPFYLKWFLLFVLLFFSLWTAGYFISRFYNYMNRFIQIKTEENRKKDRFNKYKNLQHCIDNNLRNEHENVGLNDCKLAESKSNENPYINAFIIIYEEFFPVKIICWIKDYLGKIIELIFHPLAGMVVSSVVFGAINWWKNRVQPGANYFNS